MMRKSIALLVPQPSSASRIEGDHSTSTRVLWAYVTCTYSSPIRPRSRNRSLSCRGC
jgi:hypothetical protein